MQFDVEAVLAELTGEEKIRLTVGDTFWSVPGIPRLGIDPLSLSDGPHGVRKVDSGHGHGGSTRPATCFPTGSALAASWDPDLLGRVGAALGREARLAGVDVLLGPGVNIKRTPLCGRNFEYFSEDPLLAGQLAAGWIKGLRREGVQACVKHFAANNQEHFRYSVDAQIDDRALHEIYLPAFETAIAAGPGSVMASYNRVNGEHACQNRRLLTEILRDRWGFDGAVISDWGAVNDRTASLAAGMDLQMPADSVDRVEDTRRALADGRLPAEALDRAARNVLTMMSARLHPETPRPAVDMGAQHDLAARVARDCVVLLRNEPLDGVPLLPLLDRPTGHHLRTVAVLGALADRPRFQGAGSSMVVPTHVDDLCNSLDQLADHLTIRYAPGYRLDDGRSDQVLLAEAVGAAGACDLAVVVVGLPDSAETEALDREHMRLPKAHDDLVRAVVEANPATVVVVVGGSPVEMPWRGDVSAIVQGYLTGQAGGTALAQVLLGLAEPGGRLAETFPVSWQDNPVSALPDGPSVVEYRESVFVGYRYYDTLDVPVAFPFGHGLSYTAFEWRDPRVDLPRITPGQSPSATVTVRNTGTRTGCEVVQLYLERLDPGVARPRRQLAGFAKVFLEPDQERDVVIHCEPRAFAHWDTDGGDWAYEDGRWLAHFARSSRDLLDDVEITMTGGVAAQPRTATLPAPGEQWAAEDFAAALGREVPANEPVRKGSFDMNTPLAMIAGTSVGKGLVSAVAGQLRDSTDDGTVFSGDPHRLAGELVPRMMLMEVPAPLVDAILAQANGRPLQAAWALSRMTGEIPGKLLGLLSRARPARAGATR